jgi:hypothetical protein
MNLRKALVLGAAAWMLAAAASSQAVTVTFAGLQPSTGTPPGSINWPQAAGVNSDAAKFTNFLNNPGNNIFPDQSQIVYFQNFTFDNLPPTSNHTDTFNNETGVYFDYKVSVNGGPAEFFRVVGDMSGSMTFNTVSGANSLAHWTPKAFFDSSDETTWSSVSFSAAPDPVTAAPSDKINVTIDGVPVSIFIYQQNPLTAPNEPPTFPTEASINGYILAVPEPSSLALLMCSGIAGSMLLWRRRRA